MSLESGDMSYLLKLNEYLDVEEFVQEINEKEERAKAERDSKQNKIR